MTNEEIEHYAIEFVRIAVEALEPSLTAQQLAGAQRLLTKGGCIGLNKLATQAKREAYEEVERILDRRSALAEAGDIDTGGAVSAELDQASAEVQDLRLSLCAETVSP
jgi:hypothetical protein